MLKKIKNVLSKVTGSSPEAVASGKRSGPSKALTHALFPLEAYDRDLFNRVTGYVHSGANPEVLMEVEAQPNEPLSSFFLAPGQSRYWVNFPDEAIEKLKPWGVKDFRHGIEKIRGARRDFYLGEPDLVQIVRFGRVIAAIGEGPNRDLPSIPTWLHALVNDFASVAPPDDTATKVYLGPESRITPQFIAELAQCEDTNLSVEQFAALLFEPGGYAWGRNTPQEFHGVPQFLAAIGEQVDGATLRKELALDGLEELVKMLLDHKDAARAWSKVLGGYTVDSSKRLRVAALESLSVVPEEIQLKALEQPLMSAAPTRAKELLEHLVATESGRELLDHAIEAGAKVSKIAAEKKQRQDTVELVEEPEAIDLPPYEPIRKTIDESALRKELEKLIEIRKNVKGDHGWARSERANAQKIKDSDIEGLFEVLRGEKPSSALAKNQVIKALGSNSILYAVPSIGMYGAFLLAHADGYFSKWVLSKHIDPTTDLRAINDFLQELGREPEYAAELYRSGAVDVEMAWPFFIERPQLLEGWFAGDHDAQKNLNRLIQAFPVLPQPVLELLARHALGDGVVARRQAQYLLTGHPIAVTLAFQGLDSGKGALAVACAQWLAVIKDPAALPELTKRLETEKRDLVRAGLLNAVDASGGDTSEYLSPERLAAEASKVLRAKLPKSLDWFPFDLVPTVRWRNGEAVERDIIKAWIVLADKTKNPDGSGLLARYLGLLEQRDAEELGRFIVHAWIAQDTAHPSEAESHDHAQANAQQRYDWAQESIERGRKRPEGPYAWELTYEGWTLEDFHKEVFREHQGTYLGSAQADKGLLAFSVAVPGTELGQMVQSYIKEHRARRAQVEALTYALYGNGQQGALQVLMAIARQHPQRTVKEVANNLVVRVAEDRGWSPSELADRTIPTAGFDEDGLLRLSFGSREFVGRMTATGTIELSNPAGKVVKALPKPNAGDDAELAAESRKALTAARKELKAVLGIQKARLHEAMCAQRSWKAEDWTLYLRKHPILGQLISKLVWLAQAGDTVITFRPTEDGDLIDVNDESIELDPGALVSVAHGALLNQDEVAAWQEHLSDYEVAALFDQFSARVPQYNGDATSFDDHAGHMTDTFSFRGVATKRGYRRGQAEDGGWFSEYTKEYSELGITVRMEFTGSYLPEENIVCATESVYFSTGRKDLKLKDVPKILLAEAYEDYSALAALGPFDPKYRDKSGV